ncbi:MAG: thiamine pyrophosphate-binding protein [Dehalococcoidia bacterium]
MADGYARASGRVGVCLGTSVPARRTWSAICTAMMDSVPMVNWHHRQRCPQSCSAATASRRRTSPASMPITAATW